MTAVPRHRSLDRRGMGTIDLNVGGMGIDTRRRPGVLALLFLAVGSSLGVAVAFGADQARQAGAAPAAQAQGPTPSLASVISGRVTDAAGRPIENAGVVIWRAGVNGAEYPGENWADWTLGEAGTDEDGRYELAITVPQDAPAYVVASYVAEGYGIHEDLWTSPGSTPLPPKLRRPDVRLGPGDVVTGRLLDHAGEPVPDTLVFVGPNSSPYHPVQWQSVASLLTTRTDETGRFRIEGVNRGAPLRLHLASPVGERRLSLDQRVQAGVDQEIRLPEWGTVVGRVVSAETGEGIPEAQVLCRENRQCGAHYTSYFARGDQSGRFQIDNVVPSHYEIIACASGRRGLDGNVRVHPGEKVECEISAAPALDVRGTVVFRETGEPATGFYVFATQPLGGEWYPARHADNEGRFAILGLLPATYMLPWPAGAVERPTVDLGSDSAPADSALEVMGAGADSRLTGTVRDAAGQSVPAAWVAVSQWPTRLLTAADERGRYEVRTPRAHPWSGGGPLRILGVSPDMAHYGVSTIEADWRTGQQIDIHLTEPLQEVTGRVRDERGSPIAGARIVVRAQGGRDHPMGDLAAGTLSAEDGSFTIGPIDPQVSYFVTAELPGHSFLNVSDWRPSLTPGGQLADLVLAKADGSLSGRVLDEQGRPLVGVTVRAQSPSTRSVGVSGADGRYRIERLVADDIVSLMAVSTDYGPLEVQDVIVSAQAVDIRFPGPATHVISGRVLGPDGRVHQGALVTIRGEGVGQVEMPDALGRFSFTRLLHGKYSVEAALRESREAVCAWDVETGVRDVVLRFPSDQDRAALAAKLEARRERVHPLGARVSMAENAYPLGTADAGALPVSNGHWMMRRLNFAHGTSGLSLQVGKAGEHRVRFRARNASGPVAAVLRVQAGMGQLDVEVADPNWREYTGTMYLDAGQQELRLSAARGWAVDIEWVEVGEE